jgi:DinB family protein
VTFIDPVAQPNEYQNMLLGYLGDQDPADVQAQTPEVVAVLVSEADDLLRTRPAEGEWSVLELIGHLYDAELVSSARYRWILAHDQPPLAPYDQDLWVQRLRHNEGDPEELLESFGALRRANLALWAGTTHDERERFGMHAERGPESVDLMFRMLAGHDLFHIEQMNRTLASLREA